MNTRSPIGLDLGGHTVKAVQLDARGRVAASACVPRLTPGLPIEAGEADRIAGVLYRAGFSGTRVAISAPKHMMHRLTLDLPPVSSGAPIEVIAQTELARQRRLEPGKFEFRWYETPQPPRHGSGARAIAVSCTHTDANELLDHIESAGFTAVALHSAADTAVHAAARLSPRETAAVLDLGWTDATFVSIRDGAARFVRCMPACGLGTLAGDEAWLANAMGAALRAEIRGPSNPAALAEFGATLKRYRAALLTEIVSSIAYLEACEHDETPTTIRVTGGGAAVPGLIQALRDETGLRVEDIPCEPGSVFAPAAALAAAPTVHTERAQPRGEEAAA